MATTTAGYKRTLTGDGQGFRYETKITALAALRLYNNSDEFYLASNFEKGDKFDDIVFTFRKDNQWSTWFIQLKHKEVHTLQKKKISVSTLRSKGQDFLIRKYLDSYKTIVGKFRVNGDDVIFGKPSGNSKYLIYTNACFNDDLVKRNHETVDVRLLSTNPKKELNIKFDCTKDDDILSGMMGDPKLFQFIDNLYFCSNQASEDSIGSIIQSEIKTISNKLSNVEIKYVTHQLCEYIYTWCKTGKYLTKEDIKSVLSRSSTETQCGRKNECSLLFTPNFLKFVANSFGQDKLFTLNSVAESCTMSMALLKQMGLFDEPNKVMALMLLQSPNVKDTLLAEWNVGPQRTLIVDCEGDLLGIDIDNIVKFVKELMAINPNNRIILVSAIGNATVLDLSSRLAAKQRKFNCTLKDLTVDSKSMLVEREVLFQGYKTPLRSLMPNSKTMEDVTNMASMTQLLQGREVSVGIKPVDHIPYYVTRVLTRQSAVSSEIFTDPQIDACFALSGITLERAITSLATSSLIASSLDIMNSAQPVKKIIILEGDPETDFEAVSKKVKTPVHWFEKSKRGAKLWQWKKSTSKIENVVKYLENQLDYVATDNIMEIREKVVVITAEPGMGKSTMLEHLAAETKRLCPHLWVISLALNDYTEHLDNPNFIKHAAVCTKNLIAAAAGVDKETSKFDARLFSECYGVTGNMIVLLDGFDEITPYYTEQGLALIDSLRKSAVIRIWVTARPVLREKLEKATHTLSYTIKPFETKDQQNFLHKFWKHELPSINDVNLKFFIEKVLELLEKSFDDKLNMFTGIPLQTRMLAEVFQGDIRAFHETGNLSLKERINGLQLFQEFVKIKSGIQMEKAKVTVTNAVAMYDQKRLSEAREQDLMDLALLTLLPRDICCELVPPITPARVQELKSLVSLGNEKSGIVLAFKGETPQFIHRTFAEYFVALFLSKNFEKNRQFLTSDRFFDDSFEFVRYLFDQILATGKILHEAVLNHEIDDLNAALASGALVDDLDAGGRSSLHLCATQTDSTSYITSLIAAGANVDLEDSVLCWRPIQYAVKVGAVNNIAPLLEHSQFPLKRGDVPVTWTTMLEAVRRDYLQLLLYLLDNGIYAVECLDGLSPQKWLDDTVSTGLNILHLAAAYNAWKILKYLLRKDTRDCKALLIEKKTSKGLTPLLLASSRGCYEAVTHLLDAGADFLATSPEGRNLVQFAVETQSLEILNHAVKIAVSRNIPATSFLTMAVTTLISDKTEWGSLALQFLFSVIPDIGDLKTTKGLPLLVASAIKGNEVAVRHLCESGSDVNVETAHGTPLHLAVTGGHEEVVRLLLASPGINIDICDAGGWTPLLKAASKGYALIFQLLIDAGANVKSTALDGSDLSHAVSHSCDESIFFYAVESGFDFRSKNCAGETGLSLLEKAGEMSLVNILVPPVVKTTLPILESENPLPLASKKHKEKKTKPNLPQPKDMSQNKTIDENIAKKPFAKPKRIKKKPVVQVQNKPVNTEALLNMFKELALKNEVGGADFEKKFKSFLDQAVSPVGSKTPKKKPYKKGKTSGVTNISHTRSSAAEKVQQPPCISNKANSNSGQLGQPKIKQGKQQTTVNHPNKIKIQGPQKNVSNVPQNTENNMPPQPKQGTHANTKNSEAKNTPPSGGQIKNQSGQAPKNKSKKPKPVVVDA